MSDADERDDAVEEEREEGEDEEELEEGEDGQPRRPNKSAAPAAAAPVEPEEELPDEKPWSGVAECVLPVAPGLTHVAVKFPPDGTLPSWVAFLCNDDEFWFKRTVSSGPVKKQAAGSSGGAGAGDEEGEEGGDEGADAAAAGDTKQSDGDDAPFDPTAKFVLVQSLQDGAGFFNIKTYEPPAPVEESDEAAAVEEAGGDAAAAAAAAGGEEGEEGEETVEAPVVQQTDEAPVEQAIEVVVDAVTLAALFAPRTCLTTVLQFAAANLSTFVAIASAGFAVKHRELLDSIIAATLELPQAQRRRRSLDFAWLVELCNSDDKTLADDAEAYLLKLLSADIVPSKPIPASALATTSAVNTYLTLLLQMPKSLLVAWSKPLAGGDDDAAGGGDGDDADPMVPTNAPVPKFLLVVLLDLRRRAVRASKGKPALREAPLSAHKASLATLTALGGGDKGVDTLAAPNFSHGRPYFPHTLQLRMSDIMLLALGRYDAVAESFDAVFKLRVQVKRDRSAPFGLPTLLFESFAKGMNPHAISTVVRDGDVNWFSHDGAVDVQKWAKSGLSANPHCLDHCAQAFAQRWSARFLERESLLHDLEDSCHALYDRLREVERFYQLFERNVSAPGGQVDQKSLDTALERCSAHTVCTGRMMYHAATARNHEAVLWLLNKNVATVDPPTGSQPMSVLQYAVTELRDADLTLFLVHCGADLNAPWAGGLSSGTCAVQDAFSPDAAAEILDAFRGKEAERITDPRCKVGLLHACPT